MEMKFYILGLLILCTAVVVLINNAMRDAEAAGQRAAAVEAAQRGAEIAKAEAELAKARRQLAE